MRRRWCEWEQPHTLSWRTAAADDAEWMSGKSRDRLALLVLTEASSWMSVRRRLRESPWLLRSRRPTSASTVFQGPFLPASCWGGILDRMSDVTQILSAIE